jgi:hypothetical protein
MTGPATSIKPTSSETVGGVYNVTPPVLQDGQGAALQFDINGRLKTTSGTLSAAPSFTPANSTKPTSSEIVGGVYNVVPPVLADGQGAALQLDVNGNLKI